MSHYVLLNNGTPPKVIGTNGGPAPGHVEAPDNVQCGWQLNGQTWEKSAALLTRETKESEGATQRANLISVYTAMFNGTGTTGERATRLEKSLCWVVRHNLNLVD